MSSRRDFFKTVAGATAGAYAMGRSLSAQAPARRQVSIAGKRVRVIDVHAHGTVPIMQAVKGTPYEKQGAGNLRQLEQRIPELDKQGVDVQAISINGFWWYEVKDQGLARAICTAQNEGLAAFVKSHPDRFVANASVPLQFPELAAEILQTAVKNGARGVTLGGHVNGEDLSLPKFDPFWAKAAEMNELVFMHPGGAENIVRDGAWRGRGDLGNIMGNPLETTYFLSRLVFDGVFDRHPRLRVCGAHAGGYLPSYFGRTEAACDVRDNANCANKKRAKEYLRSQIMIDTMIFSEEGLRHLVNEMGVSQIVYGTDNPFNWPVTVDLVLNASFLNNTEKEAILGGTLARLLRITS